METKDLPMAKRMLEENIGVAVNVIRNKFRAETGIDVISITIDMKRIKTTEGKSFISMENVKCELDI